MANQNVQTPRFYIDKSIYFRSTGQFVPHDTLGGELAQLNPSNTLYYDSDLIIEAPTLGGNLNYAAFLGHDGGRMNVQWSYYTLDSGQNAHYDVENVSEIVNFTPPVGDQGAEEVDEDNIQWGGYSILEFPPSVQHNFLRAWASSAGGGTYIGAISIGQYIDMPHSPELSLTMAHEYDGINIQKTIGGSELTQVNYHKPSKWGNLDAWQLGGWQLGNYSYFSSGRRVWDLSFNHLSNDSTSTLLDLEPENYYLYEEHPSGWKDNWFTNVIHYTNGGQLPFIFCPDPAIYDSNGTLVSGTEYDESTWSVPEFAICKFDMDTFKRTQVANGVYNIKVKIKESW